MPLGGLGSPWLWDAIRQLLNKSYEGVTTKDEEGTTTYLKKELVEAYSQRSTADPAAWQLHKENFAHASSERMWRPITSEAEEEAYLPVTPVMKLTAEEKLGQVPVPAGSPPIYVSPDHHRTSLRAIRLLNRSLYPVVVDVKASRTRRLLLDAGERADIPTKTVLKPGEGIEAHAAIPGVWAAIYGKSERIPWTRAKPKYIPAGGTKLANVVDGLLTFKRNNVTVIKGTEDAGINFKQDNVDVVTGGTGSITVEQDDVP